MVLGPKEPVERIGQLMVFRSLRTQFVVRILNVLTLFRFEPVVQFTTFVLKRSMNPGFAGIDNELFGYENNYMI